MPKSKKNYRKSDRNYRKQSFGKSVLDDSPTLIIHRYYVPHSYSDAVNMVFTALKEGVGFNKACDQVAALYPHTINRNKLAEHTLKFIANS